MEQTMQDLMGFLENSPTAFHAASAVEKAISGAGFIRLDETAKWNLPVGGKYFVMRYDSSIIAFVLGDTPGYRIVAAHTDSPCLKLKAGSEQIKAGAVRVSLEVYGAPILATWLDRPLGIAGRVLVEQSGDMAARLFRSPKPVATIPSLAIHLNRDANKGFELNAQDHIRAIFSTTVDDPEGSALIQNYVAREMGIEESSIREYDLYLYEDTPPCLVGTREDMVTAGRLDNLGMTHAILAALLGEESTGMTRVAVLFDSEEIGSLTRQGAQSSFLRDTLHRVELSRGGEDEDFYRSLARSYLISADAAHAVHPNYLEKHDENFSPKLNKGPVIKINAGQKYTTTAETAALFASLCRENGIPYQKLIGRSDMRSGGTIGPAASSSLGVKSVDVGNPLWAMHSVRETAGVKDHAFMIDALSAFYRYD